MRTVTICGCGGSGKSTLARELGQRLNLPVTHLDMEYYDHDWNPLDQKTFAARQRELVADPAWVLDGNYAGTMPIRLAAADTVVFLDLPARTCLWGILQRRRYRGNDALARHLRGQLTWRFVKYILSYRRTMRPRVEALIAEQATGNRDHLAQSPPGAPVPARAIGPRRSRITITTHRFLVPTKPTPARPPASPVVSGPQSGVIATPPADSRSS